MKDTNNIDEIVSWLYFTEGLTEEDFTESIKSYGDRRAREAIQSDEVTDMIEKAHKIGEAVERERWINQPANEHDEAIRKAERNKLKEIVGFVDEEFLTLPNAEEYVGEWVINKERQRILQTLNQNNDE